MSFVAAVKHSCEKRQASEGKNCKIDFYYKASLHTEPLWIYIIGLIKPICALVKITAKAAALINTKLFTFQAHFWPKILIRVVSNAFLKILFNSLQSQKLQLKPDIL